MLTRNIIILEAFAEDYGDDEEDKYDELQLMYMIFYKFYSEGQ